MNQYIYLLITTGSINILMHQWGDQFRNKRKQFHFCTFTHLHLSQMDPKVTSYHLELIS
eukprot:UN12788